MKIEHGAGVVGAQDQAFEVAGIHLLDWKLRVKVWPAAALRRAARLGINVAVRYKVLRAISERLKPCTRRWVVLDGA